MFLRRAEIDDYLTEVCLHVKDEDRVRAKAWRCAKLTCSGSGYSRLGETSNDLGVPHESIHDSVLNEALLLDTITSGMIDMSEEIQQNQDRTSFAIKTLSMRSCINAGILFIATL